MITFCLSVINENNEKEAKPCGIIVPEKRATTTVRDKLMEAMLADLQLQLRAVRPLCVSLH
jgi:hypothetical protein